MGGLQGNARAAVRMAMVFMVAIVATTAAGCERPRASSPAPSTTRAVAPTATAAPPPTTSVAKPTSPETARAQSITIGWAGDSIPASTRHGLPRDPATLLAKVQPELEAPDLMIVNLEGTMGTRGVSKCASGGVPDCHAFQAPPGYATSVFVASGVDAVNTANNHSHDYGDVGQSDTRRVLKQAGLAASGGVDEVTVVDVLGMKVALVGLAPYRWGADLRDPEVVRTLVRRARAQADLVVVMMHIGTEGKGAAHTPDRRESYLGEDRGNAVAVAHLAIDEGADLVVGSGPHVLRGMEYYKGKLVAYSLGNLVGYGGAFYVAGDLALSGILHVELRADGTLESGRLVPLRLGGDGTPRPDADCGSTRHVNRLSQADFGARGVRLAKDGTLTVPGHG